MDGKVLKSKTSFEGIFNKRVELEKTRDGNPVNNSELIKKTEDYMQLLALHFEKQKQHLRQAKLYEGKTSQECGEIKEFIDKRHSKESKDSFQQFKKTTEKSLQEAYNKFRLSHETWDKVHGEFSHYLICALNSSHDLTGGMKDGETSSASYARLKSAHENYKKSLESYTTEVIKQGEDIKKRTDYYVLNVWSDGRCEAGFNDSQTRSTDHFGKVQRYLENFSNKYISTNNAKDFDLAQLVKGLLPNATEESISEEIKEHSRVSTLVSLEADPNSLYYCGRYTVDILNGLEKLYSE